MKKTITEKIEDFIVSNASVLWSMDEQLFSKMFEFITNLDPDVLTDDQIEFVMNIIQDMETQSDLEESILKSKKSKMSHNRYSKKYARLNKKKIKDKKKKFDDEMKNRKKVMSKSGRTATGRNKTRYNTRGHTN